MPNIPWTESELFSQLSDSQFESKVDHDVSIIKFDDTRNVLIGVDQQGFVVFGAPQTEDLEVFRFSRAYVENNKTVEISNGKFIERIFMLRILALNVEEIHAVSTIFAGLHSQICESGDSESAQASVNGLRAFLSGLGKIKLSRQLQVGLFGELTAIYANIDSSLMVQFWHSSPMSTYDFGSDSGRLEVKTSTQPTRHHWLRNSQTLSLDKDKLTYLSIYSPEIASGTSIPQLAQMIKDKIPGDQISIFESKLDFYDVEKAELEFDLSSAIASFKYVPGTGVPIINSNEPAVLSISWKCDFSALEGSSSHAIWDPK